MGDKEDPPIDPYTHNRESKTTVSKCVTRTADDSRRRFLEYDRMVLTFSAKWNDDLYQIMYFLMDDTIAIRELHKPNSGKDPVAMLLRKMKIPKNWKYFPSSYPGIYMEYGDPEITEYYTPKDFRVSAIREKIFFFPYRSFLFDLKIAIDNCLLRR